MDDSNEPQEYQIIPWGLHPVESFVFDELKTRMSEYGLAYSNKREEYKGPKVAWARVFSNGTGLSIDASKNKTTIPRDGFLLSNIESTSNMYSLETKKQIIGYDANGSPHEIDTESSPLQNRPPPTLISVDSELEGGNGLTRKITIKWRCSSLQQLEYLERYFLSPKLTVVIEWGWNTFDFSQLIDLSDTGLLYKYFNNGPLLFEKVKQSKGQYDAAIGFIIDFSSSNLADGGYECTTIVKSPNWAIEGSKYREQSIKTETGDIGKGFLEYVFNDLDKLNQKDSKRRAESGFPQLEYKGRFFYEDKTKKIDLNGINKRWIRMDLIVEIINAFFAVSLVDRNNNKTNCKVMQLDISNTIVSAHPYMKSTSSDCLVPNKYAPKFSPKDRSSGKISLGMGNLSNIKIKNKNYFSAYSTAVDVLRNNEYSDYYDDLDSIVHQFNEEGEKGNSFPMFEDSSDGLHKSGYYGYLKDIYISTDKFKDIVGENDTIFHAFQALLSFIAEALCNIPLFKIQPANQYTTSILTVIDESYNPYSSIEAVNKLLPRITYCSANGHALTDLKIDVKMDQEMAQQCIMETSTKNATVPPGTSAVIPSTARTSQFTAVDRLFAYGVMDGAPESKNAEDSQISLLDSRSEEGNDFVLYTTEELKAKDIKAYLIEKDAEFLRNMIVSDNKREASYLYSPIMGGTTLSLETLGISGFNFLDMFTVENILSNYSYTNAVWQIKDIKHTISDKTWKTSVSANVRPIANISLNYST